MILYIRMRASTYINRIWTLVLCPIIYAQLDAFVQSLVSYPFIGDLIPKISRSVEQIIHLHDEHQSPLNSIMMQGGSQERYFKKVITMHFTCYYSLRADSEMRHSHTTFGETS